ncbi:ARM repeat-containing protein [Thelephora terrestris]|uniref:ARM repeat-containing protein n=1 Tax=Thelephora terrestris TaxID=56493 RepID=A0A9P6HJI3_9AGAM|nr:ARM repeat-containing protein [Thelephora terrestris]
MGKAQKKKAMRRHNPMRVPDNHLPPGLSAAAETSQKKDQIPPILQKMESADPAERKWACVAVSNIIQNDPSTRRLLQGKDVVGILITRLSDSEEEVVVEAAGALRNLCIDGGHELCGEMYNKNVLAPLKAFIPKIAQTLSQYLENPKSAPENAQKVVYELADSVITMFWCLSETSSKALNTINQASLVPFLMSFLVQRKKLPLSAVASAAQCLYVLTEDNPPAAEELRTNGSYTSALLSIAQGQLASDDIRGMALKVLSAGILWNISPLPPLTAASAVDIGGEIVLPLMPPLLTSISLPETSQQIQTLVEKQASLPQMESLSLNHTPKSEDKTPLELDLERFENRLRTIQLGLEILTSVCATLPDSEISPENDVADEAEEAEEDADGEEDTDDQMATDETPAASQPNLSRFAFLIPTILSLIEPTHLSFPPPGSPSIHPPITSALGSIHLCALECLNNLFLSLATSHRYITDAERAQGMTIWNSLWTVLQKAGDLRSAAITKEQRLFWETAIGVLWGVSIVFKGIILPEEDQVRLLVSLSEAYTGIDQMKVKLVGTLECLAQHPLSIDANRVIASYLVSLLPTGTVDRTSVESTLQVTSALIDIYSDETVPYDINFRENDILGKLIDAVEPIRKLVRGINKKKPGGIELKRRGEETRDNLVDFIKYRRGLRL